MKVLVTGASGLLGSHVAELLSARGTQVRALVRKTSNRRHLETLRNVELFEGSVEQGDRVREAIDGVDAVVHAAGLVKARNTDEFFAINVGGTSNLIDAARRRGRPLDRFVYVSSLEACGPSADGTPVPADQESPVTSYGRSKLAAEKVVLSAKNEMPVVILRPGAIYGPRDEMCIRDRIRGPLSLNINEELGCLVEGFDTPPYMMMPHHKAYQGGLVEKAGYTKAKDFYAWSYKVGDLNARTKKAHEEIKALPEVSHRTVSPKSLEGDVALLCDVFNDAWSENWGFVPFTRAEGRKMAADFKLLLLPEITCIVSIEGEPAAVALAVPNLNEMTRDLDGKLFPLGLPKLLWRLKVEGPRSARLIILGIRKKWRHIRKYAALSAFMYAEMNDGGKRLGIKEGELGWTLEDNGRVNAGIATMGAKRYKTYRVYEKPIANGAV